MTRRSLGPPPYRMRAEDAAAYVGDSVSTFYLKVREGRYPQPAWAEGQNRYWRTTDLIEAMESAGLAESQSIEPASPRNSIDEMRRAG